MNTERTEKFVNAIACDLEEGGFRQVSGTTLRRTLATAVSAALPLLADTGIPASQHAELAEQQGDARTQFEAWAKGEGWKDDQFTRYSGGRCATAEEYHNSHLEALWYGWKSTLAARQPGVLIAQKVGDYRVTVAEDTITVSHGRDVVFAYSAGDAEPIVARQPGAQEPVSPMARMAAALREKAAIEHTEYSQRVQSGEWGPMPEAGTQADFCRYCEGSGWGGESRKTKCPACSGTGMAAPPAQGIDLGQVAQEASDPSTQIHIGTDAATGGQLWHSDGKGGLWCGNTYHRTPQQLWDECQSVLSDLRNLADDQRDAAPGVRS